jgi:hypothetical protein
MERQKVFNTFDGRDQKSQAVAHEDQDKRTTITY